MGQAQASTSLDWQGEISASRRVWGAPSILADDRQRSQPIYKESMTNKKYSYQELKQKLDDMFDTVSSETNIHQLPDVFRQMLITYNVFESLLFDLFNEQPDEQQVE